MTAHPNRSRSAPGVAANPAPEAIRAAREAAGLTQTHAAQLIYSTLRTWQQWEAGDRRMHPGLWELFKIKAAMVHRTLESPEAGQQGRAN